MERGTIQSARQPREIDAAEAPQLHSRFSFQERPIAC
jgi:hypothetical protein